MKKHREKKKVVKRNTKGLQQFRRDVQTIHDIFGLTYREARKKAFYSHKWARKRSERHKRPLKRWKKVVEEMVKKDLDKAQKKEYIEKQEEDYELETP